MNTRTNEDVYKDILGKLTSDSSINSKKVIVGVKDGVVTLTGKVESYSDKWILDENIKSVKGVSAIVNNLSVQIAEPNKRTDIEIAQAATNALKWNILVPHDDIRVVVENGHIILSGEVNWHFQRKEAYNAVRRLVGVYDVSNLITLKATALIDNVKERIKEEFERNAEIDAENIKVEVENNEVILKGKVHSWEEVRQAKRAAWLCPGVKAVKNELSVVS